MLEASQRIGVQILRFAALVHEFNSASGVDKLTSIRSNQAKQLIDELNALLTQMKKDLSDNDKLLKLSENLHSSFTALSTAVFAEKDSLYSLKREYIDQNQAQRESVRLSKVASAAVTTELESVVASAAMVRDAIVKESSDILNSNANAALSIVIGVLVALVAMGVFTMYCTIKPLTVVADAMDDIAQGEGDLTQTAGYRGNQGSIAYCRRIQFVCGQNSNHPA